jgi:hypothetical protein
VALVVLVVLAVTTPWPFGCVLPGAVRAVTLVCLGAAAAAAAGALRSGLVLPAMPLAPVVAFLAVGLVQLVPWPAAIHRVLAPGTHGVWHPAVAAAAAVLDRPQSPLTLHPDATVRALAFAAGLVGLALLAAPALGRPRAAALAAAVVAAGGVVLSVYAIFARARFGPLLFGRFQVPTVSPFGPFVSKNHFAGYVNMAALLGLGLHVGLRDRARGGRDLAAAREALPIVFSLVAVLAMALAVLASTSRGGAVSLAAGGLAFAAFRLAPRIRSGTEPGTARVRIAVPLAAAVLVAAALIAALPAESRERIATLAGASFRLDTWKGALRLAASSPWLGSGLGSFEDAYPRFKRGFGGHRVQHAESDYLELLSEAGLVGWVLALSAAFLLALGVWRRPRHGGDPEAGGVGAGALAGLCALAVHSAFDFNLRIPSNAVLAALLAAIAASAAGVRPASRAAGAALAAGAGALALALLALPPDRWPEAQDKARQATLAQTPEVAALRLERAEAALRPVVERRPALAEAWLLLGGARLGRGERAEGMALAQYALTLDPERADLAAGAAALSRWTEARAGALGTPEPPPPDANQP